MFTHPTKLEVQLTNYQDNNRVAVQLLHDHEPYAMLSVNVPEIKLALFEFIVKGYAENQGLADITRYGERFIDTGKRVSFGYISSAPIWRVR